jgi:hypothetical protein
MGCKGSKVIKQELKKAEPIIEQVVQKVEDMLEPRSQTIIIEKEKPVPLPSPTNSIAQELYIKPKPNLEQKLSYIKELVEEKALHYMENQLSKLPVNTSFDLGKLKASMQEHSEKLADLEKSVVKKV